MPIVGFNFSKLDAEKHTNFMPKKKVNSDLRISSVEKEKINIGQSDDVVKFSFEFKVTYEDSGSVSLVGHVLYMDEPKKIESLLKSWKDGKKIPVDLMELVLNTILFRCNLKALALEQDITLPPHFRLPRVVPKVGN